MRLSRRTITLWLLAAAVFAATLGSALVPGILPVFHAESGIPVADIGRSNAVFGAAYAIAVGIGLAAVGFLIHLNATTWTGHLCAVVVWTLGELVTFPCATTIVANLAPADLRATYQGVYNLIWSAAHALAPVVGGQILAHLGADWMWRIMAGVLVSAAVGLVTTRKALQAAVAERTGV